MIAIRTSSIASVSALALLAGIGTADTAKAQTGCTTGTWQTVEQTDTTMPSIQSQTTHFAIRYDSGALTTAQAQALGTYLESIWTSFVTTIGFPQPYCNAATKYKVNVNIRSDFGLSGGVDGDGHMGMWISVGGSQDQFGLAHEFTHALQGSTGGLRDSPYSGWIWESHANWMTTQLSQFRSNTHCSVLQVNYPHLYYGSTRMRYCNWQFWEYLKNAYGYATINDIWKNAPKAGNAAQPTGDPFTTLMANKGWSISQLNTVFGTWAMRNVNWDYTNPDGTDQGAIYRSSYGAYVPETNDRILRLTTLDPMNLSLRRFNVSAAWAPQRWGYNLVRLHPDPGATSIGVAFRGVTQSASATSSLPGMQNEPSTIPAPNSGWRWGVVAINSAGQSRYSALQSTTSGTLTFALQTGDQAVYMVVLGAPSQMTQIRWDQPYYSIYRYPWMVQFTNAMPAGFQSGAPSPIPGGSQHANGGGWKAAGTSVASTAYVGPYARVLAGTVSGTARVEDHAVVAGGTLQGNAVAKALSVIRGNTIIKDSAKAATTFLGLGEYEQNIVLSGTAQNIGDVEQRGASFASGMYYGFVDQAAATDPTRGSTRTTPVPEVTATPNFTWY